MTLQINTRVDSITWPLNQNLTNQEIISQLELTVTENGHLISNDNLSINRVQFGQYKINAEFTEFKLYTKALTAEEVATL